MKVSILLPAYKSDELLEKIFIPSLKNITCDYEIIIRDNGGNGDLKKYSSDKVKIIGDSSNIGLNPALNECAHRATGDFFYLPHTDMRLMPGCLEALLAAAKNQAPGTYLFCSRSIEKSSHIPMQLLRDFGTSLDDFKEKELYDFFQTYTDKGIVSGYRMPFFGHKKLIHKLVEYNNKNKICNGPFDDSFFSYATDNDLFFNCYDLGVRKFWLVRDSVVYHLSGHSNKQQAVDKDDRTPYTKLCKKWSKYNISMNIDQSEQALVPWNLKVK